MNFFPSESLINEVIDCKYLAIEAFLISLQKVLESTEVKKPVIKILNAPQENYTDMTHFKEGDKRKLIEIKDAGMNNQAEVINELRETIDILESKINKLNQVIKIKDEKIRILENRIFDDGLK